MKKYQRSKRSSKIITGSRRGVVPSRGLGWATYARNYTRSTTQSVGVWAASREGCRRFGSRTSRWLCISTVRLRFQNGRLLFNSQVFSAHFPSAMTIRFLNWCFWFEQCSLSLNMSSSYRCLIAVLLFSTLDPAFRITHFAFNYSSYYIFPEEFAYSGASDANGQIHPVGGRFFCCMKSLTKQVWQRKSFHRCTDCSAIFALKSWLLTTGSRLDMQCHTPGSLKIRAGRSSRSHCSM